MAIRVGHWDCETCGHQGILGPETQCPNCGSPRPENVEFYLPEDAEAVQDEEKLKEANAGADWICAHCGGHNKAWDDSCQSCGSPKEVEDGDKHIEEKVEYFDGREQQAKTLHTAPQPKNKGCLKYFLYLFLFVGVLFGLSLFESSIDVKITELKWERKIELQEYKQVTEEDWSVPSGGTMLKSRKAVHHHDKKLLRYETRTRDKRVKVGEERYVCGSKNKGNGYFEDVYCTKPIYETRQETYEEPIYQQIPVYATKYQYTIMKWVKIQPLVAKENTTSPYWPKLKAHQTKDRFKTGKREETYWAIFHDHKGKKQQEEVPYNYWKSLQKGKKVKAKKSMIFGYFVGLEIPK